MRHANFGGRDPYFGRTGVRIGMVPLDTALVSSCRLTIVTMPLTEAVWPQYAVQVFGGAVSIHVSGKTGDRRGTRGSELVSHGSGRATLFASLDSFSA